MSVSIVIDLITSVPFLVLALIPNGTVIYVPYFLRSIMIVPRLESALHYGGQYRTFNVSAYKEKLAILATAITVIIYLGVCSFEFFENRFALSVAQGISEVSGLIQPMHVLYFVMITMSTVGYGDVTPKTIPGQVLVVIMILVAIIVLPGLINDVTENFRLQNSGGGAFTNDGRPFVVICGVFNTVGKVKDIAQAFLGADSDNRTRVVLLSRFKPNAAVRLFLKSPLYRRHFTILHGSGLDTDDLERVQLRHASAAFILADAAAPDPQMEDEHNTVRAWAFDDEAPHVQLYIDNLLPGTNILQEKTTTAGVCLQDLRQTFLALSCMYRGIGTLIINLLQSTNTYADYGDPWRIAYADGRSNQFCDMRLHSFFVGLSFTELALYLYEEFQMVLFGLQIFVEARGVHHVTLNPGASYRLGSDDLLLLIAPSRHDVSDLANLTKDQFDRTFVKAQLASRLNMCQRPQPNSSESSLSSISESRFAMYVKGYPTIAGSHSSVPQCYLLRYPAASKDMFVKDASHMSGHILVCTLSFDVARFVCTLRTTSLIAKDVKPILILSPKLPTKKDLAALAVFPEVYYAQGDARNRADLETIGNVRGADKVVVLKMRRQVDAHGSDQEDFSDSSSIMVSHLVYDMFHREGIRKFLIVELGRRTNIKFLRPTVKHDVAKRTLQRGNQPRAPPAEVAALLHDPYFTPVYAGGRVISSSMVEPILFQTFHTPCTIDVFHALCGERFKTDLELDELMDIAPAGLCQIAVPALAVDRPYAFLFQILATEYGVIPIGLLRESIDPAWGNKLPFVITNPVRSLLVKRDDLVFVIASPSNLA
ncbi:hypothetical protein BC831DRAFT_12792 [Entophlyctis helioformis]|nr:hypothetical protein BC831DRAFT_12792 [Entophlyctis helioformis]